MTRIFIILLVLASSLMADVESTTGQIKFDTQMDNQVEMTLDGTGLGIGITPSTNLHLNGNAIVSDQLFIGRSSGSSNLNVNGTIGYSSQVITSSQTLSSHSIILVNPSSDNITLTLPDASSNEGRTYYIKRVSNNTFNVSLTSSNNIDGSTDNYDLSGFETIHLISDGSDWFNLSPENIALRVIASENLIGWWKLDELSGNTIYDSSGQDFHGSIENVSTNQIGQDGILYKSVELDGSNDYIDLPTLGFTRASGKPLSVTAWVKPSSNTIGKGVIFGNRSGSGSGDLFKVEVNNSNQYAFEYDPTGNGGIATGSSISTDWAHLASVYDGSDIILYINGLEVAGNTGKPNAAIDQDNYQIGKQSDANGEYFDGNIDDVRLYNKALTQDEISQIQNVTR